MPGIQLFASDPYAKPLTPEEEKTLGEMHFVGDGCVYSNNLTRVTCTTDYGRNMDLTCQLDCDAPHPKHWLAYVLSENGFDEILYVWPYNQSREYDVAAFLMENGLAPRQRFEMDLRFWSTRDYWGEYDEGIDLLDCRPAEILTDREAAAAWTKYARFMGWRLSLKPRRQTVTLEYHEYSCKYWRRGKSHGPCSCQPAMKGKPRGKVQART